MIEIGAPARSPPASGARTGSFDDLAGKGVDALRPIRDEIKTRIQALLTDLIPAA